MGSGSECESPRYTDPYLTTATAKVAEPVPTAAPYPDYNSINNNLSILDMDDDTIKIETRLEVSHPFRSTLFNAPVE